MCAPCRCFIALEPVSGFDVLAGLTAFAVTWPGTFSDVMLLNDYLGSSVMYLVL